MVFRRCSLVSSDTWSFVALPEYSSGMYRARRFSTDLRTGAISGASFSISRVLRRSIVCFQRPVRIPFVRKIRSSSEPRCKLRARDPVRKARRYKNPNSLLMCRGRLVSSPGGASGLCEKNVFASKSSSDTSYRPMVSIRRHGAACGGFASPSSPLSKSFRFSRCQNSRCPAHLFAISGLGSIRTTSIRSGTISGSPS